MELTYENAEKLFSQKKYTEAHSVLLKLLEKEPDNFVILAKIALIYQIKKNFKTAIKYYKKSLAVNPNQPAIFTNLGSIYRTTGEYDKAIEYLKKDLNSYSNLFNLGILFEKLGKISQARKCYYSAIKLKPEKKFSLQIKTALLAPSIYKNKNEILKTRKRITDFITRHYNSPEKINNPVYDIGITNFYLGYHGLCNNKLNAQISKFYRKHIDKAFITHYSQKPVIKNKIKIGFVSTYFRKHSVSDVSNRWIAELNKNVFETVIFSIGDYNDNSIKFLKNNSSKFYSLPENFTLIQDKILSEKLNILFFTDIGLEPFTYFLAHSKLAPVQITYTGHPDTTGIKTIDYYISSKLWETEDSEKYYSEQLIKFNSLTWNYKKPETPPSKGRDFFNFSNKDNIYCIHQSLFKIHPDFDEILNKILIEDPFGKIVIFFDIKHFWWKNFLTERFKNKIKHFERILFIPSFKFEYYLNFLKMSDILLDTLYFNGGVTSLQAFAIGAPIVTLPSKLMRGRFTYGMYKKMGINDLIAKDLNDYVQLAVNIANDKDLNKKLRNKILKNNSTLFEDKSIVYEFEKFFKSLF